MKFKKRSLAKTFRNTRIANHVWANSHAIDFDNASIIDKGGFRTRKILEAWHSKLTPNADNNSCPLPGQYNILFNKHSQLSAFLIFTLYFTPNIFYLFIILPVEGCSANSRKLVFLKVLARDHFLNFIRRILWLTVRRITNLTWEFKG